METSSKDFLVIALAAGTAFFCGRALMHTMPPIAGSFAALAVAFAIYAFAMHKAGVITYSDVASMARSVGFGRMFDSGNKA